MKRSSKPSSRNLNSARSIARPGRCRYCRCTDARACPNGCSWYDAEDTVCSSAPCIARFRVALAERARKLIRIGIEAVGFTKHHLPKGPSAYPEAAVIIDTLLAEMRSDSRDADALEAACAT